MKIPRHLLSKYNQPVPRYTSYPPANFFKDLENPDLPAQMIRESNDEEPKNVSLYIHIPFCNKICHYCGCNSMKIRDEETVRAYMKALRKEMKLFREAIGKNRKVSQVHWGGGTPNALPVEEIRRMMDQVYSDFDFIDNPEIAVECNPAGLDLEYIRELHKAGFNRTSLGIQDFREDILNIVNREVPDLPISKLVEWLRESNDMKVNLDFIYGLPLQTKESFRQTIQRAIEINPDRLVTFSYAHVPWAKPAQKVLEKYNLPDPDLKISLFENACIQLEEAGYKAVGLDHFAKPEDELYIALQNKSLHRNFQGYCTRETTGQVYAAGISSISQLSGGYFQNTKNISRYIGETEKGLLTAEKYYQLNSEEKQIREIINELMCNLYLDWDIMSERMGINVHDLKETLAFESDSLAGFEKDGLLNDKGKIIEITETGKFFIRNIASVFDPKLRNTDKKFSKSI